MAREWASWSAPAIIFLRLPPDPTSATHLRALDPDWHRQFADPPRALPASQEE
jgi:nicotinate-nucleotide adenylyltransferase